jgi:peptidoglycan DL-endopeptidase CwlO
MTSKKIFGIAIICGAMTLSPISALAANIQAQYVSVEKTVNFRESPSTSGKQIRYLKAGEELEVLSRYNSYWLKVKDSKGKVGYVSDSEKYVSMFTKSIKTDDPKTNAEIVASVSFRKGPSTSDQRIRYLKKGEKITILDEVNKYWYKAKDQNGTIGYLSTNTYYIETNFTKTNPVPTGTRAQSVQKIIQVGKKYMGTPYEFGSNRNNTSTFDCSDFVRQVFKEAIGVVLPTNSRTQADYVKNIGKTSTSWKNLKPGDLLFFMEYKGLKASAYKGINKSKQRITHVGIYLGDGKMLHTFSKDSGGVRIDNIADRHWDYRFVFGGPAF